MKPAGRTLVFALLAAVLFSIQAFASPVCVTSYNTIDRFSFSPSRPALSIESNSSTGMIEFKVTVPYIKNNMVTLGFWPTVHVLDRVNAQPICSNRSIDPSEFPPSIHDAVLNAPDTAYDLSSDSFAYPAGPDAGHWIRESSSCHTITYRASYSIAELSDKCAKNGIPAVFMRSVSATGTVTYGGTLHIAYDWAVNPESITSGVDRAEYSIDFDIKVRPTMKYISALSSTNYLATQNYKINDMDLSVDSLGRAHMTVKIKANDGVSSICEPIALGAPQEIDFADLSCSCSSRCADLDDGVTTIDFHTNETVKTLAMENGWILGMTSIGPVCDKSTCDTGSIQGVRFSVFFEDAMSHSVEVRAKSDFLYGRAAIGVGDKLQFLLTNMDGFGKKIKAVHICTKADLEAASGHFAIDDVSSLMDACPEASVVDGLNSSVVTLAATPGVGVGLLKDSDGTVHPIPYNKEDLSNIKSYDDWASGHVEGEDDQKEPEPTDPSDPGDGNKDGYVPVVPDPKPNNGALRPTTSLGAMVVVVVGVLAAVMF